MTQHEPPSPSSRETRNMASNSDRKSIYRSRLGEIDKEALDYLSSLNEDYEILLEDLEGTEAHVIMLCKQNIIPKEDAKQILRELEELKKKAIKGELELKGDFEDVHEFIESRIIEKLGLEVGGKLHTGRSRNDQIALDIRLRTRKYLVEIWEEALRLAEVLLAKAEEEQNTIITHYTHLQQAQIGYLSQYLLAHLDHIIRDIERIKACYQRINKSPLGACAIAGSTLPLDRELVARLLGFDGVIENSIDAVSSRDFALEALSIAAIMMTNLSRIAEDLIIWSTSEFDYIELPDSLASPSSIMPHKKNPCILELLRAKTAKIIGLLTASLTLMKGIPTGYNRDLQEGKPLIWEALRETHRSIKIISKTISQLKFKKDRLKEMAAKSYASALELAEALIKYSGLSLREAHKTVGALVRKLYQSGISFKDLSSQELSKELESIAGRNLRIPQFVLEQILDVEKLPQLRITLGSSSPAEIKKQLEKRKHLLKEFGEEFKRVVENLSDSRRYFEKSLASILRN